MSAGRPAAGEAAPDHPRPAAARPSRSELVSGYSAAPSPLLQCQPEQREILRVRELSWRAAGWLRCPRPPESKVTLSIDGDRPDHPLQVSQQVVRARRASTENRGHVAVQLALVRVGQILWRKNH